MLQAAVAAGFTLALGTPLSGVLFSIETTASIYIISNLWKSFFCAVICIFVTKALQYSQLIQFTFVSQTSTLTFSYELLMFIILGFVGGIVGAMISTSIAKFVYIRRKSQFSWLNNRFKYALIVAFSLALIEFCFDTLRGSDSKIISVLFSNDKDLITKLIHSTTYDKMFLLFIVKLLMFIFSITMNIPAGVFSPVICAGALFGYCFCKFFKTMFDLSDEAIYSMIGASCVFSGFSHTVSAALIIFEITGQTSYLAPLLLATLIANLTAKSISMNIFDVLLVIKNLPNLSSIKNKALYSLNSSDIMTEINYSLELNKFTAINCMDLLSNLPRKYSYVIPIVDETGSIVYTVSAKSIFKSVFSLYESVRMSYNFKNQNNFDEFFFFTRKKFFASKRSFFTQISHKVQKLYKKLRNNGKVKSNENFYEYSNQRLMTILKKSNLLFNFIRCCGRSCFSG